MITMKDIKIIDIPMGEGKTTGLINYMNNHPDNKYLFITPFLDEVERIIKGCKDLDFAEPNERYSKLSDLKNLISNGRNIASTHALFSIIDSNVVELLYANGYILVLDEVLELIEPLPVSTKDIQLLLDGNIIRVDETGRVHVSDKTYKGKDCKFSRECNAIKNQNVYYVDNTLLLCIFNPSIFEAFEDVIVLTYMFEGSLMKSYFELYDIKYSYYKIVNNEIVEGKFDDSEFINHVRELIHIYDGRLNNIGEKKTALCFNWYTDKKYRNEHRILKNNMYNYLKNIAKTTSKEAMWSTFTGDRDCIKEYFAPPSYAKGFVACNSRATNKFAKRNTLIYSVNVFLNPYIVKYFSRKGIRLNEENYALSQLLQWIWRSAIRNNEEINIYIPSRRMRLLLKAYLNKETD